MIAYTDYAFDARVRREAETLAANGFQVLCLTLKDGAEPRRFQQKGVEIRELGIAKYRGKSALAYVRSYLRFLLASSAVCLRLLRQGELDVVHVHNVPDFLILAGLVPRMAGRKVVLDVHDSVPETFATKFSSTSLAWKTLCLEERLSALVAHRVICVNHPQQETLIARGLPGSKTFVSMNVPDPTIFNTNGSERCPTATNGEHFNLVYHGTMAERLGVDLIIRAVAELRDRIPGIRLHLWGRGDDLSRFRELARQLNTEGVVLFNSTGFPLHELPGHLHSMDLGVVGNRRTAAGDLMLPVKLLEYVALGIPVVAPRLRAIEHYFSEDMVAYFEPENVGSLAESIYRLRSKPEVRCNLARQAGRFLSDYGWERQGPELVTFYRAFMENKK
jgi:glycosyltransferase involved in cell wall biosynthesis